MKKYLTSTEDVIAMLLGELSPEIYNMLQDEDFEAINEAVVEFGHNYVLVDAIYTIEAKEDEIAAHSLQVVKFVYPDAFLVLEYKSIGTTTQSYDEASDVLGILLDFLNDSSSISEAQATAINTLVHSLK